MREFEPRRLRLFFCFLLFLLRYCIVSGRRRVLCVARIYSLGGGKAFGEKIIILRIKTSSSLLYRSLSFFLRRRLRLRERERERGKREGKERFSSIFVLWRWIKIKGRWSPRTTTKKQLQHLHHHRMLFIITIMVSNNKTIILRRSDRKP